MKLIPGGGHFELHASLQLQEVAPSAAGVGTSQVLCSELPLSDLLGAGAAVQGFGVPPLGPSASPPEVAPTPAPIGIGLEPPTPPDVLGQHSSGETVRHPIANIAGRKTAIQQENKRMAGSFGDQE
jgi:hypothetical protein